MHKACNGCFLVSFSKKILVGVRVRQTSVRRDLGLSAEALTFKVL
jgi:hypothetical protein